MADGFNNVSDIVANIAVLIGLRMARKPADCDHHNNWKIEDLEPVSSHLLSCFSLTMSIYTIQKIIPNQETKLDPIGAVVNPLGHLLCWVFIFTNTG